MTKTKTRLFAAVLFLLLAVSGWVVAASSGEETLPDGVKADRILVEKSLRRMTLFRADRPLKTYTVSLGAQPSGTKTRRGDNRTPEGHYRIISRNPHSRFHLSLKINYPNAQDLARAKAAGLDPGGDIMIHGLPPGYAWLGRLHRFTDWTQGCIAVTNEEIEEIWRAVPDGTPVEIRP
ncbi:MAG: L,D-transpeptidase family protein [Thermodesulfobacteriota bacterium]